MVRLQAVVSGVAGLYCGEFFFFCQFSLMKTGKSVYHINGLKNKKVESIF